MEANHLDIHENLKCKQAWKIYIMKNYCFCKKRNTKVSLKENM